MSLCLAFAGVVKALSVAAFTLVWTHSIEKVEWQEDWRITARGLELVEARVKGSGAGMEPPPEARLMKGWFRWRPNRPASVCSSFPVQSCSAPQSASSVGGAGSPWMQPPSCAIPSFSRNLPRRDVR